jgi:hypothetical protein
VTLVPDLDPDTFRIVWYRGIEVVVVWQAFSLGFSIRHAVRRAGWSSRWVRGFTALTWAVAFVAVGRLLLPLAGPAGRSLNSAILLGLLIGGFVAIAASARIVGWIAGRATRGVLVVREVERIYGRLGTAGVDDSIREELAGLDRLSDPATTEYIQLARARVLNWSEGGPQAKDRDERWFRRMSEIRQSIAGWQPDAIGRLGRRVRAVVHAQAPVLTIAAALIAGRAVLAGPLWLLPPAVTVLGYLATWVPDRIAVPAILAFAIGLAATAIAQADVRPPSTGRSAGIVAMALAGVALTILARRRLRESEVPAAAG